MHFLCLAHSMAGAIPYPHHSHLGVFLWRLKLVGVGVVRLFLTFATSASGAQDLGPGFYSDTQKLACELFGHYG